MEAVSYSSSWPPTLILTPGILFIEMLRVALIRPPAPSSEVAEPGGDQGLIRPCHLNHWSILDRRDSTGDIQVVETDHFTLDIRILLTR